MSEEVDGKSVSESTIVGFGEYENDWRIVGMFVGSKVTEKVGEKLDGWTDCDGMLVRISVGIWVTNDGRLLGLVVNMLFLLGNDVIPTNTSGEGVGIGDDIFGTDIDGRIDGAIEGIAS